MGELAELIVTKQFFLQPELWKPYDHARREKSAHDTDYHLNYLAKALDTDAPMLFCEYLARVKVFFAGLKFPTLDCTRQVLATKPPGEARTRVLDILDMGN